MHFLTTHLPFFFALPRLPLDNSHISLFLVMGIRLSFMTFLIFKSSLKPDEEAIDFEQFEAETEPTSPKFLAFNLLEWAVERQANGLFISDEEQSVSIDIRRLRRVAHVQTLTRDHGD
jgi:hypothetical protein